MYFSFVPVYNYGETRRFHRAAENCYSSAINVMMLGSKGILPPDTYGLLRTLCSHNPKNIRNSPYSGYFLMFCGSQGHAFSYKHETHDLLTLVSQI